MTKNALTRLNGLDVDMMRRMGVMAPKGRANVKKLFRGIGRALPVVGSVVTGYSIYQDPNSVFDMIGISSVADGSLYPPPDGPQF